MYYIYHKILQLPPLKNYIDIASVESFYSKGFKIQTTDLYALIMISIIYDFYKFEVLFQFTKYINLT